VGADGSLQHLIFRSPFAIYPPIVAFRASHPQIHPQMQVPVPRGVFRVLSIHASVPEDDHDGFEDDVEVQSQ
jgi:hypothetical protein